jgi:uncharacterized protein (TIGR02246 family)
MRKPDVRWVVVTPLMAAVLLWTGGCNSTPQVNVAAEEKLIRDAEADFVKAAATRDADKVIAFYADDAVMLPPGEALLKGKAAIRASWSQLLALPDLELSWTPTKVEVAKSGDLAYDYGTYAMSHKDSAGKVVDDRGKYATVWKKGVQGGWKVVLDTTSSDLPGPAAAAAAKKAAAKKAATNAKKRKR